MKTDRPVNLSTSVLLAGLAVVLLIPSPASSAARSGVPPYCVLKGGPRGIPLPQICRFYDYQQCLQAAADLRGNCVVNIDYHGGALRPPAPFERSR